MEYFKELRTLVGNRPLILPGSVVVIINEQNQVLLQHRKDGTWGLAGGLMELGESLEDTARREVLEETGLTIGKLDLLGIFSGQDYYFKLDNGDELYSVTTVYLTRDIKGSLAIDKQESINLEYFSINNLPDGLTAEYRDYLKPYIDSLLY